MDNHLIRFEDMPVNAPLALAPTAGLQMVGRTSSDFCLSEWFDE